MNKIFIAAAVVASFGYAATAEAHRDDYERNDWFATMHSVPPPAVMQRNLEHNRQAVFEGRNAATPVPAKHLEARRSTH